VHPTAPWREFDSRPCNVCFKELRRDDRGRLAATSCADGSASEAGPRRIESSTAASGRRSARSARSCRASPSIDVVGWLDFVSRLVDALAWPAAIVAVVVILRRPIGRLLDRIKGARYRGVEFDLGEVEEEIKRTRLPPAPGGAGDGSFEGQRTEELVRVAPRAAVIDAWLSVERELDNLSGQLGLSGSVSALEESGAITSDLARLIRDLRRLRGEAVHAEDFEISPNEARAYADATARVAAALRRARKGSTTELTQ
jgi:hypothetical protein